jgi:aryl-alcohol dehydrogenase-like predicted oxidoreductase
VQVSELCLGCMMFGMGADETASADMVDHAIDAGINFVDTANVYSRGVSEDFLGKALKRNGKRDKIVLATKVHAAMADDDPNMRGNHRRHIIEQCDASLRRLQTDWIDLYQIHRPMSGIPIDETLRALDGTSAPAPTARGNWSSRCGCRRNMASTASCASSRRTTSSTAASSAS